VTSLFFPAGFILSIAAIQKKSVREKKKLYFGDGNGSLTGVAKEVPPKTDEL
jgi:hypothetical protein